MEIPKNFEEQKKLVLSRGFELGYKNYDEFWDKVSCLSDWETFGIKNGMPAHITFSRFGNYKQKPVRMVHAMLEGSCRNGGLVACYKVERNRRLTFVGIHEFKQCPKRKYKKFKSGLIVIKKY